MFPDDNSKRPDETTTNALREMVRVTKDSGVIFADDDYVPDENDEQSREKALAEALSTEEPLEYDGGLFLSLRDRIDKMIYPGYYPPGTFLVFAGESVDPSVRKVLDKTPHRLSPWRTV